MATLALFVLIGFALAKLKIVGKEASTTLSRFENNLFLPALVLYTFIENFNLTTLSQSWKLLLFSLGAEIIVIPVAIFSAKLCSKDGFIRRMYTYGLSFSNFGFMGNAVFMALRPDLYQQYVIFTLPLWTLIYIWGVPGLLIEKEDGNEQATKKQKILSSLKSLANPMFIALIIGAIIGITGLGEILLSLNQPKGLFFIEVIKICGNCMSPIAMIMTGITFAFINFKKVFSTASIYVVTILRLVVYPLVFGGIALLISKFIYHIPDYIFICFICSLSMPLGLNTIVIPSAYGKDTSIPAGMALASHLLSVITIPLIFTILL